MFQAPAIKPLLLLGALLLGVWTILQYFLHPLRDIPGPFLARFTRVWYLLQIRKGDAPKELIRLHAKYGKIVRIAPNQYSIDDPDAVKTIYGRSSSFRKSDFYFAFGIPGIDNVFITRSNEWHAQTRKLYHQAYTMSAMTAYEGYVDETVGVFMQKLRDIANSGRTVKVSQWLQFFAFDVIGCISGSKRFGFLDKGADHDALIGSIEWNFTYGSLMGVYSELHAPFFKVMRLLTQTGLIQQNARMYLRQWTEGLANERIPPKEKPAEPPTSDDENVEHGPKDMATKFAEYHEKDPERFTYTHQLNGLSSNINAGSDTTSASLSSIVYYLSCNPEKLRKLRGELHEAQQQGIVSSPIKFKEAQQLDYLQAVIKESMRLIPAIGMPLSREVPEGGAQLCGHYFPAGTVVGIHAWVAHQNTDVFGSDAAEFRPERWLKGENDETRLAAMDHYFLSWGSGTRTCLGRNVALLEILKVVPEIVRHLDFEMARELREAGELKIDAKFLAKPKNMWMRVHVCEEESK